MDRLGKLVVSASVALASGMIAAAAETPLLIHVGGTMRPAIERICKLYEEETGEKVELNALDSGQILATLQTTRKGDIAVVHDPFLVALEKEALVDMSVSPATLTPVIVVRKGNPKRVKGIADFARADLKVGLPDAEFSTAGHIIPLLFVRAGIAAAMDGKEAMRARSGGEIANAVKIGALDAGIVWNAVAVLRADALDVIDVDSGLMPRPGVDAVTSATYGRIEMAQVKVHVIVLKTSSNLRLARKFAELAGSERGRKVFAQGGFSPAPAAAAMPTTRLSGSIFVYCAAGVKEPVDELARLFERETGVKVEMTVANSGQLLGQIETTHIGDLYIPGDVGFAAQAAAKNLVSGSPAEFCYFVPGIYVKKGNPKGIRTLADLARPGLRLALADESSAIGKFQSELVSKNGLDGAALKANTRVSPATVTDVALAVKMGTVDAGIIWTALGSLYPEDAEIVTIPKAQNVVGKVAACALAGAKNPAAARSFMNFLLSDKGRSVLSAKGYAVEMP